MEVSHFIKYSSIVVPIQLITYCHIDSTDKKITVLMYISWNYREGQLLQIKVSCYTIQ